jgi:hypothetical protein
VMADLMFRVHGSAIRVSNPRFVGRETLYHGSSCCIGASIATTLPPYRYVHMVPSAVPLTS